MKPLLITMLLTGLLVQAVWAATGSRSGDDIVLFAPLAFLLLLWGIPRAILGGKRLVQLFRMRYLTKRTHNITPL